MTSFEESGLSPELMKAITEKGFKVPTPIQAKTIPQILNSDGDLIALAQTGTGKTAAFGLPIIQKIDSNSKKTQAIILLPTRELCIQVAKDLEDFSKYSDKLYVVPVYGGSSIDTQIRALKRGAQIVVGTPGRTLDLIKRKKLILTDVTNVVLDEADEMLSMGFKDDLDDILGAVKTRKQTLLFSATMPKEISKIARKYMNDPEEITVGAKNTGAENVDHVFYMVNARDRYLVLKRIADINPHIYGIVFCRTRRETKEVADKLMEDGYNADALHGDLSQAQRDSVMNRFREKNLQLLVATDIAARGLDVNDLTHIINYNLPDELEAYIHRSGRTGRAGKKGISITIIHSREQRKIKLLEDKVKKKFNRLPVPDGKEICEKQLFNLIDKIENTKVDDEQIEPYMDVIYKKLSWLTREDLIKHFVSAEFNRFLEYYKNAKDLNILVKSRDDRDDRGGRGGRGGRDKRGRDDNRGRGDKSFRRDKKKSRTPDENFSRFFLNIGKKDGIQPVNIIGLINDNLRDSSAEIGKIDILDSFSFFEVDKNYEDKILKSMKGADYEGRKVNVELSEPSAKRKKSFTKDKGKRTNFRKRN